MSATASGQEQRVLSIIETARAKRARFRDSHITMAHGAGGQATASLIEGLLVPALDRGELGHLADAATIQLGDARLAMTSDSFVVKPLRFPGGSIGTLAVNGTVNDLAMAGAQPIGLTLSLILEEGLSSDTLRAEVQAIAEAASAADVEVLGGDTKVVERGHADGMYICSTGIGRVHSRANLAPTSVAAGDRILVSGSIGEHGTAILLARNEFDLDASVESDTRSLWPAAARLLEVAGAGLHCMRDATRGGVASALNELARASGTSMVVDEAAVPVGPTVAAAAELLGIDPLHIANEGKFVAFVDPEHADAALEALRGLEGCERATAIGWVTDEPPGMVLVKTTFGGRRVLDQLVGDPLPRIC